MTTDSNRLAYRHAAVLDERSGRRWCDDRSLIDAMPWERRRMTLPPTTTELLDPLAVDGEDLACLGLRRANDFMDVFADLRRKAHDEWVANLPKPRKSDKPTKNRKPNVIQQARTAGIDVARIEMKPDGTVVIITGKPE